MKIREFVTISDHQLDPFNRTINYYLRNGFKILNVTATVNPEESPTYHAFLLLEKEEEDKDQ